MTAPHPLDHPDVDAIWVAAARALGIVVRRADDAYASTDGRGTMTLGTPATLDADDCVAVLVLHELCHGFVQGLARWSEPDFGLDNTTRDDEPRELATLRVQAALADRVALRGLFFSTTEWRPYYEGLPTDPFEPSRTEDPTREALVTTLARAGWKVGRQRRFARALDAALQATLDFVIRSDVWGRAPGEHPLGGPVRTGTCASCVWNAPRIGRESGPRCRSHARPGSPGPRIDERWPACTRFEDALDCQTCGACCREAYHAVQVGPRDAFRATHPTLVVSSDRRFWIRRSGDRCSALQGVGPYSCAVYPDRPRTCREFTQGSENCRVARVRVGLSAP